MRQEEKDLLFSYLVGTDFQIENEIGNAGQTGAQFIFQLGGSGGVQTAFQGDGQFVSVLLLYDVHGLISFL